MTEINEQNLDSKNKLSEFEENKTPKSKTKTIYKIVIGIVLIFVGCFFYPIAMHHLQ